MASPNNTQSVLARLRQDMHRCSVRVSEFGTEEFASTGIAALDQLLPGQGLRSGMMMEWLHDGGGTGALSLSLHCVKQLITPERIGVFVDQDRLLYPPTLQRLGINYKDIVILHPRKQAETLWVLEQALRCRGIGVVVGQVDHLADTAARRLQLAVEQSGVVCFLHRSLASRCGRPWADVRLKVETMPRPALSGSYRRLRVTVLYSRGGVQGGCIELDFNDETGVVRMASRLVGAANSARGSRAS